MKRAVHMYKEVGVPPNFAMGMINGQSGFMCGRGYGFEQLQQNCLTSGLNSGVQELQFPSSNLAISYK